MSYDTGGEVSSYFLYKEEILRELRKHLPVFIYTALSLFTHLWRIGDNNTVVWDEAHFGKFGAYYLNRTFYFDVHPPLGKMLVGLAGALSGFNGAYDYPSGQTYPSHVPFKMMRILMALPGVMMVPLAWGTTGALGFTRWARHLVTTMVLCDIAWTVISRFVLLDSMLLFFTSTTTFCLTMFHTCQNIPFDEEWWLWLILTGVSIGCVISVKWVGFFVTAVVGVYTVLDLWDKFGDLRMPVRVYIRHWAARIACLILLPLSIYMICFKIHFMILDRSGPGDAQMSSLFQAHLRGNTFAKNPLEPAFGSKITLKNMGYGGGLLHSHVQTYPSGSQQQQVTCYHYNDANNEWIITPRWEDPAINPHGELRYLKDLDFVRLVHKQTGRNLHSHSVVAPVTKLNNEVSCYGNATIGDSNDYWKVHVVDDMLRGKKKYVDRIHSLTTRLRFQHVNSGCWLRAANAVLPQWGFKQVEVSCDKNNNPKDEHTYWNIESHSNDRLPAGDIKLYRSPFLRDFWHLNIAMWTSNNALIPDADKEDNLASSAWDWPFLYKGMRMNGWSSNSIKFYLVGNPIVWWSGTLSLILFGLSTFWYLARFQRKYNDFAPGEWDRFVYIGTLGLGGWFLHFLPSLIMARVLYLHHSFPGMIFAVYNVGFMLDHFVFGSRRLTDRVRVIVFLLFGIAVVGTFFHFRNCVFGLKGPIENHRFLRWRQSWNIYDK
ncbi:glycosyltransferase family 39 protein [Atractiella rhizophila]|nr:glycosyltransferase family 39 protein [Atractiella rhizophila]